MFNSATVIGTVVEVYEERGAQFVAVKTGGGVRKGGGGTWEEHAAIRFYGDVTKHLQGVAPGDLVRIDAAVKARPKNQGGGWFVDVEGRYLVVLQAPSAARPRPAPGPTARGNQRPDDDIPF